MECYRNESLSWLISERSDLYKGSVAFEHIFHWTSDSKRNFNTFSDRYCNSSGSRFHHIIFAPGHGFCL